MIYLFHGDHHLKSRNLLNQKIKNFKEENREIIRLPQDFKIEELKQALESSSLFGQEKAVIVENLFSKKGNNQEKIIDYLLGQKHFLPEFVIWESEVLQSRILKKLPPFWKILLFKTPRLIFKFLDSLKTTSSSQSLALIKECLKTEEPEFIFFMLARQIRLLILARENLLTKMAPWQKDKLKKQTSNFTLKELLNLHKKLLEIDRKIKTGKTLMPLNWHLDLLIAGL